MSWFVLDDYSRGSSIRDAIIACRQWAIAVASMEQMAVIAYAHVARQLKYEDTDKVLALTIISAAMKIVLGDG